ncbi:hypothetical protein SAMN05444274_101588 [Mariniphaga anaerophila]|uniref:GH26 domain-containing protein n=1 Tax=Mariniphaga anaerophila TaxID=1484053 RepID=A0A1M4U689_9BACT|nr:hypothetical protein [Mariniphaga anaerophila]SHE52272.1 hypothetical protein SAMN05444274_101588 [Mariniphaga anaerophila]
MSRIYFRIIEASIFLTLAFTLFSCSSCSKEEGMGEKKDELIAKFEPPEGKCLVFIGQDMGAIGGMEGYNNGYVDYFPQPAGITVYTTFSKGTNSFGWDMTGNDGIFSLANWGAGDCYANKQIRALGFEEAMVTIGLAMVDAEQEIVNGERDSLIIELGEWMKSLAPRPIFLRIGYEFDGHDWNHYNQVLYLRAWRRIVEKYRSMGITNVAYVWQSKGVGTTKEEMAAWYPGDDIVDWCAYTYFGNPDTEMIEFAREHNKPVIIAEATPVFQKGDTYFDADIKKADVARKIWDEWFVTFFNTIENNEDVIKAFSYINVDWPSQAMWENNPTFQKVDSRIQMNEYVSENWKKKMSEERYLEAEDNNW